MYISLTQSLKLFFKSILIIFITNRGNSLNSLVLKLIVINIIICCTISIFKNLYKQFKLIEILSSDATGYLSSSILDSCNYILYLLSLTVLSYNYHFVFNEKKNNYL